MRKRLTALSDGTSSSLLEEVTLGGRTEHGAFAEAEQTEYPVEANPENQLLSNHHEEENRTTP